MIGAGVNDGGVVVAKLAMLWWRPGIGAIGEAGVAVAVIAAALDGERHRWFLWVPVLVGVGIGVYFALPVEPNPVVVVATLIGAVVAAAGVHRGTLLFALTRAVLAVAVGFAIAKARTEWVRATVLAAVMETADVTGHVELIEPTDGRGQRITLRVVAIAGVAPEAVPRRVRIRTQVARPGISPGDPVRVRARLSPPGEPVLPGGYDFGRRAWYLGIGAVGFSYRGLEPDPTLGPAPAVLQAAAAIERVRAAIGTAVRAALPGQSGAIATALLTGERGAITAETDKVYRDSGLYHVLSISGLHMTVMAGTLFLAVRALLAAVPGVALRFPVAVLAAIGAFGYLLISGAAFATLRSYVMISIVFLAIVLERPALSMRNIALAALVVLLVWPESLLDPGFQMSFAAVTALIASLEAWQERERRLGRGERGYGPISKMVRFVGSIVISTLIAGVAVAPLAAYHFHAGQAYSVLGNLLGVPICDLIVMPALLATLVAMPFGLEAYPLMVAGVGIDAMTAVAAWVATLPGAVAAIPAIPLSAVLAIAAGGLWLALWTARWRAAGMLGIAVGLVLAPTLERPAIIVGRDGALIAARVDGGLLSAAPGAGRRTFELSRWLEHDGDRRAVATAAEGRGFRCDSIGCTATLAGRPIAITRHPAALPEDCARAAILIAPGLGVSGLGGADQCHGPSIMVDRAALRRGGVHAIYVGGAHVRIETVTRLRGERPWSGAGRGDRKGRKSVAQDAPAGGGSEPDDPAETAGSEFDGAARFGGD